MPDIQHSAPIYPLLPTTDATTKTVVYLHHFDPDHYQLLKTTTLNLRTYYIGYANPHSLHCLQQFPEIQQRIPSKHDPLSPFLPHFAPFIDELYSTQNAFRANLQLILSFRSHPYIRFLADPSNTAP